MQAINRSLLALALGAFCAAPAFAGDTPPGANTKPTDSTAQASDAVSAKTTLRETGRTTPPPLETAVPPKGQSQAEQPLAVRSAVLSRDSWTRLDANDDGKLSSSEVSADTGISGAFAGIDANADGFVTQAEYTAYAKAKLRK